MEARWKLDADRLGGRGVPKSDRTVGSGGGGAFLSTRARTTGLYPPWTALPPICYPARGIPCRNTAAAGAPAIQHFDPPIVPIRIELIQLAPRI